MLLSLQHNIHFIAKHVPGVLNTAVDMLFSSTGNRVPSSFPSHAVQTYADFFDACQTLKVTQVVCGIRYPRLHSLRTSQLLLPIETLLTCILDQV